MRMPSGDSWRVEGHGASFSHGGAHPSTMPALEHHDGGPKHKAHYTNAVRAGGLLFVTGMVPVDPENGKLVEEDAAAQTRACLHNLRLVLEAAGSSMDRVAKTTVFLTDWANFPAVDAVYAEVWPARPPARSIAQGARPAGHLLGIEAVAI